MTSSIKLVRINEVSSTQRIHLLAGRFGNGADLVCERVMRAVRVAGFEASWGPELTLSPESYDLIILHTTKNAGVRASPHARLLGSDTLTRAERLMLIEELGVPVAPWASPATIGEVALLFARWRTQCLLLKLDASKERQGIFVVGKYDVVPGFSNGRDVWMKILKGDPTTFKIDAFMEHVLFGYRCNTPRVDDAAFKAFSLTVDIFDIPDSLRIYVSRIGHALAPFGCGYFSADFMYEDGWFLIELNISGVGVGQPWLKWGDAYAGAYSKAVLASLQSRQSWASQAEIQQNVRSWRVSRRLVSDREPL